MKRSWLILFGSLAFASSLFGEPDAKPFNSSARQYDSSRAFDLLRHGQMQEAYDQFAALAASTTTEQGDMIGAEAELALGRIEMQRADADEAIRHFLKSLEWTRLGKQQAEADGFSADIQWSMLTEELIILQNLCNALIEQGKMSEAREYMRRTDAVLEQRAKTEVLLGSAFKDIIANDDAGRFLEPLNRAMMWFATGEDEKARELTRRLERDAAKQGRQFVRINALYMLMGDACLYERNDEALALAEKAAGVPMENDMDARMAAVWHEVAAQRAYLRMTKDGDVKKALKDVCQAQDELEALQCIPEWLTAGVFESTILKEAGWTNEAAERIEEIIDATRQFGFEKLRAQALVTRAEIAECSGDESMGAGLVKALDIIRTLGLKALEPEIYRLYGLWLFHRGDFDLAVQTWEQGFALSEGLGLSNISLRLLLALAFAQQECGTHDAIRSAWVRIERYALKHRDLPAAVLKDLEKARCERFANEPGERVGETSSVAVSRVKTPPSESDIDTADPVFLAPREVHTCMNAGEPARARVLVVNPSGRQIKGSLDVVSDRAKSVWKLVDSAWHVLLDGAGAGSVVTQEVEVPPGGATLVVMETAPDTNASVTVAALHWNGGGAQSEWHIAFSNDTRSVAVVNASLVEENPFYIVPFYHDIYCRGFADTAQDVRVKTSRPCRVELLDDHTGRIFAIDTTGDGVYDSPGDDILCDQNTNGLPDIACPRNNTAVLRLFVIPDAEQQAKSGEITIDISVWDGTQWQRQAEDILVLR